MRVAVCDKNRILTKVPFDCHPFPYSCNIPRNLDDNDLNTLPEGVFNGLTTLKEL